MSTYEEELDRLERKVQELERKFGEFLVALSICPIESFMIVQELAADIASGLRD